MLGLLPLLPMQTPLPECNRIYDTRSLSATSGSPVTSNAELQSQLLTGGSASMWVKIISQWLAVSLYIWTLVAPTMFPDYEFG